LFEPGWDNVIHQKLFSALRLDGAEANHSAAVEPDGHSLNLSWRLQLWQRLAGQIVERRRQLGQMQGRGWRWQRAWAQVTRAAATLLLLGGMLLPQAAPVYASSGPAFVQRSGAANPFDGVNLGGMATVTFADLDADGDLDAICGAGDGTIRYYQNTGSARVARFTQQIGAANPFDGLTVGTDSTPVFVDIDADGDLDLFSGVYAGTIAYYQNTGTPRAPQFTQQTGAANPLNAVDVESNTVPAFVDIDGDGDQDAFVGSMMGVISYYQNTGTPQAPQFSEQTGSANPLDKTYIGTLNTKTYETFVDIDGDGDQDVFMGSKSSKMVYFQNTGTRLAPVFSPRAGSANPLNWTSPDYSNCPGFVDIDADGDQDVFVGTQNGSILYYQNNGANVLPVRAFTPRSAAANPFDGVNVGQDGMPALADIDADGDLDAFIGADTGTISYYKNTGTALAPVFSPQSGADNPFDGVNVGGFSAPSFVDIDADGDLDAFIGSNSGAVYYYKNTGTAQAPGFTQQTGTDNPFNGVGGIANSAPAFADIDADGDLDAFIGNKSHLAGYSYYQNTGTAQAPIFTYYTGPDSPFSGVDTSQIVKPAFLDVDGDGDVDMLNGDGNGYLFYVKNTGTPGAPIFQRSYIDNPFDGLGYTGDAPAFADLDGDGDRDVVIGMFDGSLAYYQNTGGYYRDSGASLLATPTFKQRSAAKNPFNGVTVGGDSHPALADLDRDGDLDAVIGAADGTLRYYKNTGSVLAPVYAAQSGAANPFDGVDVGTTGAPTLADLDGDGDLDAVIGAADGTLRYYKNTGSARLPTFTAQSGAANPFNGIDVGDRSTLAFVDLDNDGDLDVFVGALNGAFSYYRNTGTALAPAFFIASGKNVPFYGVDAGQNSTLAFADVDRDGDPDALIGAADGTLRYYKNTGTAATPVFSAQSGVDNPFNGVDLGDNSAPVFANIDGDDDVDVFSGDAAGNIHYFEQTHCSFATESDAVLTAGDTVQFGTGNSALFIKVNTLGSLTALTASCTPNNHPNAGTTGLQTGFYWTISPNSGATGYDLDLTLPYKNPDGEDQLCRYDAPGGKWGCAQTSRTATDITLTHVTALSDWVAGIDANPTAVGLRDLAAHSQPAPGAGGTGLLGLLAGLGGLLAGWLRRKK
jgi:hypothetical protein